MKDHFILASQVYGSFANDENYPLLFLFFLGSRDFVSVITLFGFDTSLLGLGFVVSKGYEVAFEIHFLRSKVFLKFGQI